MGSYESPACTPSVRMILMRLWGYHRCSPCPPLRLHFGMEFPRFGVCGGGQVRSSIVFRGQRLYHLHDLGPRLVSR